MNPLERLDKVRPQSSLRRRGFPKVRASLLLAVLAAYSLPALPLRAQQASGGWEGPCEEAFWKRTGFEYDAMRVCRVATYLLVGLNKQANHPLTWVQARQGANEGFRLCWGQFPAAGGNCAVPNAWARTKSWLNLPPNTTPPPIVITLTAAEWLQSDDDVAFILAHEMGHATDAQQNTTVQTEQNEERADAIGIACLMLAGYDARASARGLQLLAGERGQGAVGNLTGMLNQGFNKLSNPSEAHPLPGTRILLMKQAFARLCGLYGNRPIGCKEGWH